MSDPNTILKDTEQKAYSFWNTAGAWVAAHPKTAIVAGVAVIVAIIVLRGLLR